MPEVSGAKPVVRGTQSFVGIMTQVWKRPSLTALEVMWRWAAGAPLLALLAWEILRIGRAVPLDWSGLEAITVFQPVAALDTLHTAFTAVLPMAGPVAIWFLPLSLAVWIVAGALGRAAVLHRLDPRLHARKSTLLALGALRVAVLSAVWALWLLGVRWAGQVAILRPAQRGGEPSVVGYCALLICGTLGLFMIWAVLSWVVHLAPLASMLRGRQAAPAAAASLRLTLRGGETAGPLRTKLVEINLVMGIVKIALLVVAMVFSACPLPFATVETQNFLALWWCAVGLVYLVGLDYFHVAHAAAYVALCHTYNFSPEN